MQTIEYLLLVRGLRTEARIRLVTAGFGMESEPGVMPSTTLLRNDSEKALKVFSTVYYAKPLKKLIFGLGSNTYVRHCVLLKFQYTNGHILIFVEESSKNYELPNY